MVRITSNLGSRLVQIFIQSLKDVSFLLVCFKEESTCETMENVFYFTSKALFVLEKNFRILDNLIS